MTRRHNARIQKGLGFFRAVRRRCEVFLVIAAYEPQGQELRLTEGEDHKCGEEEPQQTHAVAEAGVGNVLDVHRILVEGEGFDDHLPGLHARPAPRPVTRKRQAGILVHRESSKGPPKHGEIRYPIGHDGEGVDVDVEASEEDSDDHEDRAEGIGGFHTGRGSTDAQPEADRDHRFEHDDQDEQAEAARPQTDDPVHDARVGHCGDDIEGDFDYHFGEEITERVVCPTRSFPIDDEFFLGESVEHSDEVAEGDVDRDEVQDSVAVLDRGLVVADVAVDASDDESKEDRKSELEYECADVAALFGEGAPAEHLEVFERFAHVPRRADRPHFPGLTGLYQFGQIVLGRILRVHHRASTVQPAVSQTIDA